MAMRLINTTTLTLKEHRESKLPKYIILSHRWGDDEVTFEDLESGKDVTQKAGYAKLECFCRQARALMFEWAWLDTACINKSSATELGTALNSMYRWYAVAAMCLAYLQDVHSGDKGKVFEQSEWFDRGWTLQELIAPKKMIFYDRDWGFIGEKAALVQTLSDRTKIPVDILDHTAELSSCSIAQRFSWAAHRITERVEDMAYSLLGLFNVNLEMVYGEREKAFIRLQQKLLLSTADESIFAWELDTDNHSKGYSGMLAPSPYSFRAAGHIVTTSQNRAFAESNLGLTIDLPTLPYYSQAYLAFLNCRHEKEYGWSLAILVAPLPTPGQWARIVNRDGSSIILRNETPILTTRTICVRQQPPETPICFRRTYGLWIRNIEPPYHEQCTIRVLSRAETSQQDRVLMKQGMCGTAGIISIEPIKSSRRWSPLRWIVLGFDDDFRPAIMIVGNTASDGLPMNARVLFGKAIEEGRDSAAHKKLFDSNWIRKDRLSKRQVMPTVENGWTYGYGIVSWGSTPDKERAHGETCFDDLNLKLRVSLVPDPEIDKSSADAYNTSRHIWAIDVESIKTRHKYDSPESQRRLEQCGALTQYLVSVPMAFLGCGCPLQDASALMRETF